MAPLTQSYVHGASPTPLSGETIGRLLRRVTAEGPERPALVTRHQNVRWTYAELLSRSEDLAIGLRALGLRERRSRRHLVGQRQRVGPGAIRHSARRAHPRQYQSRLSRARIRLRDEEVRLPGADPERRPQEQRLFRCPARLRARDRGGPTGSTLVQRPARARNRHPPGNGQIEGDAQLRRRRQTGRGGRTGRARDLRGVAPVRRPDQHPVHVRNHRERRRARR